jgi:hypothetical protein
VESDTEHTRGEHVERDAGWEPVPGCEVPADRLDLADLDLLAEVTHPIRGRILRLLRRPRTVAELAELLEVPTTRLYHHVNRLTDFELIRAVAVRRVAAVTERRYQVVAKSFRVDDELLATTDVRELAVALCSLFDVAKLGFQRFVETGGVTREVQEGRPRSALSLGTVQLSDARRDELMTAINDLVETFPSDVDDDDGTRVTLFVAAYEEQS